MSFFDKVSEYLDQSGITSASKIYTPFTLFCIFFSIYFNAENLWVFLTSYKWEDQLEALRSITNRGFGAWAYFLLIVTSSAIGLIAVYSIGQLLAAGIWRTFDYAQSRIAKFFSSHKYIKEELLLKEEEENVQLRNEKRELYKQMASQEWTPEAVKKLQEERNTFEQENILLNSKNNEIEDEKKCFINFMTGYHHYIFQLNNDPKRAISEFLSKVSDENLNIKLFLNILSFSNGENISAKTYGSTLELNTMRSFSFQKKSLNTSIGLFSRICKEYFNADCVYDQDQVTITLKSTEADDLHDFIKKYMQ